ncbi:MAG: histidine phosphatase family protein [Acidimicrobiia bacterium]|nr:histidine phosphatase family protein [Acidimicrobiia bacterium]
MSHLIALLRHGEVHNPGHVVYADLDGYALSDRGWAQAGAAASHLADLGAVKIVTSPLQRAVETSNAVAARVGRSPMVDPRLTEWMLSSRWAGTVWEDLPDQRPGELEAYLADPTDLPFSPESIARVADRMSAAIAEHSAPDRLTVFVSHQDPVQSARIHLTSGSLSQLHQNKPGHGSVILLEQNPTGWTERDYWEPDQGSSFPPVERSPRVSP